MSVQDRVIEKFKEIRHLAVQNLPETSDEESELEELAADLSDDAKKVLDLAKEIGGLLGSRYGCVEVGDFEILWWKIGTDFFLLKTPCTGYLIFLGYIPAKIMFALLFVLDGPKDVQ